MRIVNAHPIKSHDIWVVYTAQQRGFFLHVGRYTLINIERICEAHMKNPRVETQAHEESPCRDSSHEKSVPGLCGIPDLEGFGFPRVEQHGQQFLVTQTCPGDEGTRTNAFELGEMRNVMAGEQPHLECNRDPRKFSFVYLAI